MDKILDVKGYFNSMVLPLGFKRVSHDTHKEAVTSMQLKLFVCVCLFIIMSEKLLDVPSALVCSSTKGSQQLPCPLKSLLKSLSP